MNLPFKTHFPDGTPTYFVEKVLLNEIIQERITISRAAEIVREMDPFYKSNLYIVHNIRKCDLNPKLHTIRDNKKGTWKEGTIAQPMIWTDRPYWSKPFYFVPKLPLVSVQKIEIKHIHGVKRHQVSVLIDGMTCAPEVITELAINDGFDSVDHFFQWFNKDFTGSILHFTYLKY